MDHVIIPSIAWYVPQADIFVGPTLWYFTRALAVSAYVAFTLTLMMGMLRPIARDARETLNWRFDELHQFVALLGGVLALGHLIALKLDPYIPFSVINFLLPFNEPYRPFAVICGLVATYLIALLLFTSWLRQRIPYGLWRGIHSLSFVLFIAVTAHGWLAGSDTGEPWAHALYFGCGAIIAFLALLRLIGATGNQSVGSSGSF